MIASIPNMVGIFGSSTCCTSSVGIGGGADFVDELDIMLQKFIKLRLLFVDLACCFLTTLIRSSF